ncbi:hypothetical protein QQP08_009824 [Theobroma cacao]|nr:hypothetical protein QQP08_009824 [Theobroma cacao]
MTNSDNFQLYLQSGTLQESGWSQIEEWSLRSCHIRLHREHPPPLALLLHEAKCLINSWTPWHVVYLLHGPLFFAGSTSYGPTVVHPSVQMCSRHSIASLSCKYKLCSTLFIDELENLEFEPGIMILHEFPAFGLLDTLEMGGDQLHALEVKIRCVAEPGELKHVHHVLNRQPLTDSSGAPLLQLRDRVNV